MAMNQVMESYINMYGDSVFNGAFDSFHAAFKAAWASFDYMNAAETLEDFAQGMTGCWQLQELL